MPTAIPSGFYVYAYLRAHDSSDGHWIAQSPYYIGKGKGGRAFQTHYPFPRPKDRSNILILAEGMAEVDAHRLEMDLILRLGRINRGAGCLRNFTDGGEGQSGRVVSVECRAKLRAHFLGKKQSNRRPRDPSIPGSRLGSKQSPEVIEKIKLTRLGLKTKTASSPYQGVHWLKNKSRWRAYTRANNKFKPLGTSIDPIICARLYDRYVRENNLDKPLNFPDLPIIVDLPLSTHLKRPNSSSPFHGVSRRNDRGLWIALVSSQGKKLYAGSSHDELAAAKLYDSCVLANKLPLPLNFPIADSELPLQLSFPFLGIIVNREKGFAVRGRRNSHKRTTLRCSDPSQKRSDRFHESQARN